MSTRGFTVTRQYLGLDTAWRAEFTSRRGAAAQLGGGVGRTVGVNAEMDALPGIGHGCGHNLIAMAGVAIALAIRAALEKHDVPGTVILLGTPGAYGHHIELLRYDDFTVLLYYCTRAVTSPPLTAEESGAGKQILLEKGAYKDMDVCIMYVL